MDDLTERLESLSPEQRGYLSALLVALQHGAGQNQLDKLALICWKSINPFGKDAAFRARLKSLRMNDGDQGADVSMGDVGKLYEKA